MEIFGKNKKRIEYLKASLEDLSLLFEKAMDNLDNALEYLSQENSTIASIFKVNHSRYYIAYNYSLNENRIKCFVFILQKQVEEGKLLGRGSLHGCFTYETDDIQPNVKISSISVDDQSLGMGSRLILELVKLSKIHNVKEIVAVIDPGGTMEMREKRNQFYIENDFIIKNGIAVKKIK